MTSLIEEKARRHWENQSPKDNSVFEDEVERRVAYILESSSAGWLLDMLPKDASEIALQRVMNLVKETLEAEIAKEAYERKSA